MKYQIRVFKNEQTKQAYVAANREAMASENKDFAHRMFGMVFYDMNTSEFDSDIMNIEAKSKFGAFCAARSIVRKQGFKLITQCEDLK
ncbi:hypothetical protein AsFcp4_196 [Aeromonas phage AsFcp_4]|nr:hypothetical protein ASfcp2_284 [Aeromonas phage AsFcp_2]QAX99649.1 hypothetical protein AsFcp4_196 [Aeromonas phage AsFcp_4]